MFAIYNELVLIFDVFVEIFFSSYSFFAIDFSVIYYWCIERSFTRRLIDLRCMVSFKLGRFGKLICLLISFYTSVRRIFWYIRCHFLDQKCVLFQFLLRLNLFYSWWCIRWWYLFSYNSLIWCFWKSRGGCWCVVVLWIQEVVRLRFIILDVLWKNVFKRVTFCGCCV